MSKIVTIKIVVRDSHNPDERTYEETRRFDKLTLVEEFQLVNGTMGLLGPKPAEPTDTPPVEHPAPPRNRHGDPHHWMSKDGRCTAIAALAKPHAQNILHYIHQCAVDAHAADVEQWCLENYPQYGGVRRRAGVPLKQPYQHFLF